MTGREDMVFRPDLGPLRRPTVRARAKEARVLQRAESRKGPLRGVRNIAAVQAGRKLRRRTNRRRGKPGIGAASVARGAIGRTPVGLIIGGLLVAGFVGLRLASDRPLEGLGNDLNRIFLGDLDEQGRAKATVRNSIPPRVQEWLQQFDGKQLPPAFVRHMQDRIDYETKRQKGITKIREAIPMDSQLELWILAVRDAFVSAWEAMNGDGKLAQIKFLIAARMAKYASRIVTQGAGNILVGAGVDVGKAVFAR